MTDTEIHNMCGLYGLTAERTPQHKASSDEYLGYWTVRREGVAVTQLTFSSPIDYYHKILPAYATGLRRD